MLIKRKKGWEIPESQATPEAVFRDRRRFLTAGVAGVTAIGGASYLAFGGGGDGPSAVAAPQVAQAEIGRAHV